MKLISRQRRIQRWLLGFTLLLLGGVSHSQGNCPPGYYQIGGSDVSGCAPIPGNSGQSQDVVYYYAALAINGQMKVSGSWNYRSADEAINAAYASCLQGNGAGCRVIGNQAFQGCVALVVDGSGRIFMAPTKACRTVIKETMDWCVSQSKVGQCHMLSGMVDAGTNYSGADKENRKALSLSSDELKDLGK